MIAEHWDERLAERQGTRRCPGVVRDAGHHPQRRLGRPGQHNDEVYGELLGRAEANSRNCGRKVCCDRPADAFDIREVWLRDGLQIEAPIPLSAKLALLEAIVATGVREVEATAFVSPSKVPALADAAELAASSRRFPEVDFSALVASASGAERAIAGGPGSIEYVVSAADGHSHANVGRSTAEADGAIADIVAVAHDSGATVEVIIATAWDCPFDGPTAPSACWTSPTAAVISAWTASRSPTRSAPRRHAG